MSSDILVTADGVSKKFCRSLKRTFLYSFQDVARETFGLDLNTDQLRTNEFWVLEGISFNLQRGECLGIIGSNGAGKSTLLKMLSGIILPDKGQITVKGRVAALIELGAGFHPVLTARENIYISGAILGLSKAQIDAKFDEIVAFSELEEFVDMPVKFFSSGMYVRLGFAIAAFVEPDVILLDETLAVGDIGFRTKSYNAIVEMRKKAAVILVSHAMPDIARMCSKVCFIKDGRIEYYGSDIAEGISRYHEQRTDQVGVKTGSGKATIHRLDIVGENSKTADIAEITYGEKMSIQFSLSVDKDVEELVIFLGFLDQEMHLAAQWSSLWSEVKIKNNKDSMEMDINFSDVPFNPGIYYLSASVLDAQSGNVLVYYYATKTIRVRGPYMGYSPVLLKATVEGI